nr:MAG TPA: hypothetical protein [Caudoviricetes sp.]
MNTFSVYIRKYGGWIPIDGTPVFPFSFGRLLDERLNEAYVTLYNSSTKEFRPTEDIKVVITYADGVTTTQYYIIARDDAKEQTPGKGKYKHQLYLVERTKLLEGIVCQSITFTNARGVDYEFGKSSVQPEDARPADSKDPSIDDSPYAGNGVPLPSPISKTATYAVPSIATVASKYLSAYQGSDPSAQLKAKITTAYGDRTSYVAYATHPGGNTVFLSSDSQLTESLLTITSGLTDILTVTYGVCIGVPEPSGTWSGAFLQFSYNILCALSLYPVEPWNIASCVNRVLSLAIPLRKGETKKYKLNPMTLEENELSKIKAPEFTMTQCTLREQLRVIGGFIHAEPRLTWDDTYGDIIVFDDYGSPQTTSFNKPYSIDNRTWDINDYATSLDTTASNIVNSLSYAEGSTFEPNGKQTRTVRTETMYVRVSEENAVVETTFPIYDILSVSCGLIVGQTNDTTAGEKYRFAPHNITPYVFERAQYNLLSSYSGYYPSSKSYAIYYTQGQKNIEGLFFKPENAISPALEFYSIVNILSAATGFSATEIKNNLSKDGYAMLCFRVEYIPIFQTRFQHGKNQMLSSDVKDYTVVYNQSGNMLESNYYGENVKGAAARIGNVEKSLTYYTRDSAQPGLGWMLNGYAVSAINRQIDPESSKITVGLSKDFNRISQYIGISSNKRLYEVSEKQAYARTVLLHEKIYVGARQTKEDTLFSDYAAITQIFDKSSSFAETNYVEKVSAVNAYGANGQTGTDYLQPVQLPVTASAFGNSMVFSWSYKDNYSAGTKVEWKSKDDIGGYWQDDVPYSDYYGKFKYYYFNLIGNSSPDIDDNTSKALTLPEVSNRLTKGTVTTGADKPLLIMKDSREILQFNYEIEFVSTSPEIIIGSGMPLACSLVSNIPRTIGTGSNEDYNVPYLYFTNSSNPISKFTRKIKTSDLSTNETNKPASKPIPLYSESKQSVCKTIYSSIGEGTTPQCVKLTFWDGRTGGDVCLSGTSWEAIKTAAGFGRHMVIATKIQQVSKRYVDENGAEKVVVEESGGDIMAIINDMDAFFRAFGSNLGTSEAQLSIYFTFGK